MPIQRTIGPGVGVGFRAEAAEAIFESISEFDVLEIMVDHYFGGGPRLRTLIDRACHRVPVVGHGVGLSIGTALTPDPAYLSEIARVLDCIRAPWYSEHLAFTKVPGRDAAQLLPLPRTRAVAEIIVSNLAVVRRHISIPIALENITYYFDYPQSEMSERDFLELVCRESGCGLLLDVENLYLNARNHGYDPYEFIATLPRGLVKGVHLAGGESEGDLLVDTHDQPVPSEALDLLGHVLRHQSPETIIIERDTNLEPFESVVEDVRRARAVVARISCGDQEP